ncbi:hypothetical protein PRIC1_000190 [Phytophthora ramorum]
MTSVPRHLILTSVSALVCTAGVYSCRANVRGLRCMQHIESSTADRRRRQAHTRRAQDMLSRINHTGATKLWIVGHDEKVRVLASMTRKRVKAST